MYSESEGSVTDETTNETDVTEAPVKEFNLNMHTARLLMNEPFFAGISRRVDKRPHRGVPTAGVRINPKTVQFELVYNPDFFAKLTDKQKLGVLKHEFYHLVFDHVTGRNPSPPTEDGKPGEFAKLWNYATDLAINSHIRGELPDMCLMPGEKEFENYPVGKSAEWYFAELKKNPPEDGGGGGGEGDPSDGDGQFDDHEGWGDVPSEVKEMAKERLKEVMKKAASEAQQSNNCGSGSRDVREELLKKLNSTVDWKKVLRYFIKTSQRSDRASTQRKLNRRFPYIHPGRKTRRQASIAISIDQSGSVSDAMLQAFFAELNKLASLATFTVIPFDSEVAEDKVYVWKKGDTRKWERVRYGGTNFDPPTKYVNERDFDGHIVLTDLCAPKPIPSKCQRMWMTTRYYAERPYFSTTERIIAIDTDAD
jgi:predicted metal-dependent peptidase